jgi:hypothetical protein
VWVGVNSYIPLISRLHGGSLIPTLCSSAHLFHVSPDFTMLRYTINWTNEEVEGNICTSGA